METPKIFDSELRFCEILWSHEPIKSSELHTENAVVTSRVAREDVQRAESRAFVAHNFHGSLPAFLTAFMGNSKLSKEDADVLHAMIDRFEQENSGRS